MLEFDPCRALVRPRVTIPDDGGTVPLEGEVASLVEQHDHGAIAIIGGMGSGRTTALRHLAALLPENRGIQILDCPSATTLEREVSSGLVIYAASDVRSNDHIAVFHLEPWGVDDWIEYCRSAHPDKCASVLNRALRFGNQDALEGKPALWRIVLDTLARHEAIDTVEIALESFLATTFQNEFRTIAQDLCFGTLLSKNRFAELFKKEMNENAKGALLELWKRIEAGEYKSELDLLRYRAVQTILATGHILDQLRSSDATRCCVFQLPETIVRRAAETIKGEPPLIHRLLSILLETDKKSHPMAASLLHFASGWKADSAKAKRYSGGYFSDAQWEGARLRDATFNRADLARADLSNSDLTRVMFMYATLTRAKLVGAKLIGMNAMSAGLVRADLSAVDANSAKFVEATCVNTCFKSAKLELANFQGANLSCASFLVADLTRANLEGAKIDGADFTGAVLDFAQLSKQCLRNANFNRAQFIHATMKDCDCAGISLTKANFSSANLECADFTGSSLPDVDFSDADLKGTKLADVHWPRANLRKADLRGATFHMGSTRTGHVNSTIASEGSKTGFYTDEYFEQGFKAPEEIHKGNLRGADLRGALITAVDFYLVDLRDALYDEEQKLWFQKCGAILESRVK